MLNYKKSKLMNSNKKFNAMNKMINKTIALGITVILLMSCEVENPGPIAESSLNSQEAVPGLVVGMSADFSLANRVTTYWGGVWSDDLIHSGTFAAPTIFSTGELNSEDVDPWWNSAHRARWVAENGIERIQNILGDEFNQNFYAARAYLFAGYSNRILGENVCHAVFDGGPRENFTNHFVRSEEHFTNALAIAESIGEADLRNAALAGRASVRAALGDWDGAAQDAEEVPVEYKFEAVYSLNSSRENNNWPTNTIVRGEYSVYSTPWDGVDDPRLPQELMETASGDTATAANGTTPWIAQLKYPTEGTNIPLSKGTEMLLIRAEMELRLNQDVDAAIDLMNESRNYHGLADISAADLDEAWSHLHYERGADMWIEGRRFWDLRRWVEEDGPAYHPFLENRDRCVPIGRGELDMNDNL